MEGQGAFNEVSSLCSSRSCVLTLSLAAVARQHNAATGASGSSTTKSGLSPTSRADSHHGQLPDLAETRRAHVPVVTINETSCPFTYETNPDFFANGKNQRRRSFSGFEDGSELVVVGTPSSSYTWWRRL